MCYQTGSCRDLTQRHRDISTAVPPQVHDADDAKPIGCAWFAHTGASMNPTLCERDLLEVVPYRVAKAQPGDVVVFPSPIGQESTVHRVVALTPQGLLTQGDNNPEIDSWRIAPDALQGRVMAAWRGGRRRVIHGGKRGQLEAAVRRARRAVGRLLSHPLRWIYHAAARSGVARRARLQGLWPRQPRIVHFSGQSRYPLVLRLGRRTIGRFDRQSGNWLIRAPYRLVIDASKLPRSQPPSSQALAEPSALIATALRGESTPYPSDAPPELACRMLDACAAHGVGPLLRHRLAAQQGHAETWPQEIHDQLRLAAMDSAGKALAWEGELIAVLRRLADAGVDALLLKGAPLAYTLYPKPQLRPRGDTDLLVAPEQRMLAEQILLGAGYRAAEAAGGSLASYQATYTRRLGADARHVIDLHWRLNNAQVFARAFAFDELAAAAVPVPALGSAARTLHPVHALMLACLHRVGHLGAPRPVAGEPYLEANRLIWLYDIHLLAGALSQSDWSRLTNLAQAKGLRAICLDGLRVTRQYLGTALPEEVLIRLAASGPPELAAQYLAAGALRRHLLDLRALPGWRARRRLLQEWIFPPADYMLRKYETASRWRLPWLYWRRAVAGVSRRRS